MSDVDPAAIEAAADQIAVHAQEWAMYGQIGCVKCGTFDGDDYEDHVAEHVIAALVPQHYVPVDEVTKLRAALTDLVAAIGDAVYAEVSVDVFRAHAAVSAARRASAGYDDRVRAFLAGDHK